VAKDKEKDNITTQFWEQLGLPVCTIPEAEKIIELSFQTGDVVCLIGEAGIGKSQLTKQIAKKHGWDYLAFFAAHIEREDVVGIPFPDKDGKEYSFLTESSIARILRSKKDTLLVFDEWNRGDKPVMNAIFTVMEDRRFGSVELPDTVHIVACMNPSEGAYLVNEAEKDPAFRRRLCFVAVQANDLVWLRYATGPGKFHSTVTGYIEMKPQALNDTKAREAGKQYANPASWEKVSNTLKALDTQKVDLSQSGDMSKVFHAKCAGHIGNGTATDLLRYIEENCRLILPMDVLKKYKNVRPQVQKYITQGNNDKLTEICEAVSLTLMSEQPPVKDIGPNVAQFLNDLPTEMATWLVTKIGKHTQELQNSSNAQTYQLQLSEELSQHEEYQKAFEKMYKADEKVNKEKKKSEKKKKGEGEDKKEDE
jgi:MoxR-like ATPase